MGRRDHFVSQTYLRKFAGPSGKLTPYYKKAQVTVGKPKTPRSFCYEMDGDTNPYFEDSRVLEDVLPQFENNWARNVDDLANGKRNAQARFEMAGYIAFLRLCNPTAVRVGKSTIEKVLEPTTQKIMYQSLELAGNMHPELKSKIRQWIANGDIRQDVDPKFPHALGITNIYAVAEIFFEAPWFVMRNQATMPLLTSDNPAVFYYPNEESPFAQTYVPLTPTCAILIDAHPRNRSEKIEGKPAFEPDNDRLGSMKDEYVVEFNRLVARSAENTVLHQSKEDWVERLVKENYDWRIETSVTHIPVAGGSLAVTQYRPQRTRS